MRDLERAIHALVVKHGWKAVWVCFRLVIQGLAEASQEDDRVPDGRKRELSVLQGVMDAASQTLKRKGLLG